MQILAHLHYVKFLFFIQSIYPQITILSSGHSIETFCVTWPKNEQAEIFEHYRLMRWAPPLVTQFGVIPRV